MMETRFSRFMDNISHDIWSIFSLLLKKDYISRKCKNLEIQTITYSVISNSMTIYCKFGYNKCFPDKFHNVLLFICLPILSFLTIHPNGL